MPIPESDRPRIREALIAQVDEALASPDCNIAATGGFTEEDFDEGAGPLPIYRSHAGEGEHRLEIFWRSA